MNTEVNWQFSSEEPDTTINLANSIGQNLSGAEVILLSSDLGGGKTTFVKGLVSGAGSTDTVASPSFMICREYNAPNIHFYHYDFYRLDSAGIMKEQIQENLEQSDAVVVIEWADIVSDYLPQEIVRIKITNTSETGRLLDFSYPPKFNYLFEGINKS